MLVRLPSDVGRREKRTRNIEDHRKGNGRGRRPNLNVKVRRWKENDSNVHYNKQEGRKGVGKKMDERGCLYSNL